MVCMYIREDDGDCPVLLPSLFDSLNEETKTPAWCMLPVNITAIGRYSAYVCLSRRGSDPSSCSVTEGPPIVHLQRHIVSLTPEQDKCLRSLSIFPLLRPLSVFPWKYCVFPRPTVCSSTVSAVFRYPLVVLVLVSPPSGVLWLGRSEGAFRETLVCLETCEATNARFRR